jgi:hypothetical protein
MIRLLKCEPVMVASLLKALLVCAVAFGLPLSEGQQVALVGVAGAILALGGAARQAVTPLAKLKEEEPHAVP